MISQRARYAFKALFRLARAGVGESVQIKDICEADQIPRPFLEQILLELKRSGFLGSRRGKEGGYFLLRDPSQITVASVLRLLDGPFAPLPCLSKTAYRRCDDCADEASCDLRRVFGEVYGKMLNVFETQTLASALKESDRKAGSRGAAKQAVTLAD
ncbi:MAG: Rrf2 family transcriptional regulator [Rhizobiales bacterium]|nr:Rrf2 family transcriptional regulator [Hyphomicrobiales bacterium]